MQGLELRKNSRRTPEKTDRRVHGSKRTPKEARAGLGLHKQVGRVAGRRQASLEEEARRRKVAHSPAREMQSPAGKTRVGGAWMGFWFRCFGTNWRSPPGAPCGVGKRRLRKSSPEKSPAVNVF